MQTRMNISIDEELLEETRDAAERSNQPLSRYVRAALKVANSKAPRRKVLKSVDAREARR